MPLCNDCQEECDCFDPGCRYFYAESGCICSMCAARFLRGKPPKAKKRGLVEMFEEIVSRKSAQVKP